MGGGGPARTSMVKPYIFSAENVSLGVSAGVTRTPVSVSICGRAGRPGGRTVGPTATRPAPATLPGSQGSAGTTDKCPPPHTRLIIFAFCFRIVSIQLPVDASHTNASLPEIQREVCGGGGGRPGSKVKCILLSCECVIIYRRVTVGLIS